MGRRSKASSGEEVVEKVKKRKSSSTTAIRISELPPPPAESLEPVEEEPTEKVTSRRSLYQKRKELGVTKVNTIDAENPISEEWDSKEKSAKEEIKEKATSCLEIPEAPEIDSDLDENCDCARIGEEITQELLESALGVSGERFYHKNASRSVTLELRNTWLRIIEAEWLDEYKLEIGRLSGNVFLADVPPAPLPFDTWSRGTLEVLDPEQQRPPSRSTASMLSTKTNDTSTSDFNLPPPLPINDASESNPKVCEFIGEDGDYTCIRNEPSLTTLFRGKSSQNLSLTKLCPEDGFNIPALGRYSHDDGWDIPSIPPKRMNLKTNDIGSSGEEDNLSLAAALQPHHVISLTKFKVKERLTIIGNTVDPEKK